MRTELWTRQEEAADELWTVPSQGGEGSNVRVGGLVPCDAHHVHCAECTVLAEFLICLICVDEVVDGEEDGGNVTKPERPHVLSTGEAAIESSDDPGDSIKGARVLCRG